MGKIWQYQTATKHSKADRWMLCMWTCDLGVLYLQHILVCFILWYVRNKTHIRKIRPLNPGYLAAIVRSILTVSNHMGRIAANERKYNVYNLKKYFSKIACRPLLHVPHRTKHLVHRSIKSIPILFLELTIIFFALDAINHSDFVIGTILLTYFLVFICISSW